MTPLRKFFFDDVRKAPGPDWIVARDVPEAKLRLATTAFDVMSLDHDIGMQMMCDKCYDEIAKPVTDPAVIEKLHLGCQHMQHGTDLAKWMVEQILEWPRLIIIHSANPYGAQRMADLLDPHAPVLVRPYHMCRYDTIIEGQHE